VLWSLIGEFTLYVIVYTPRLKVMYSSW